MVLESIVCEKKALQEKDILWISSGNSICMCKFIATKVRACFEYYV